MKGNQPNNQAGDISSKQHENQTQATDGTNNQSLPKRDIQISQATKDRAEALKAYIERKYSRLKVEEQEKRDAWDMLHKKMDNMNLSTAEQELIKRDIIHKESERYRQKRKPITVKDFEPIAIIGRGAFGEVRVCRFKETGEILAVKKMNKAEMIYKNQVAHVRAERDILSSAANPWIVELKFSFQDDKYLYLVMEYLPGGDFMTLLMKKDILSEDEAKFYIAEAILAVESVHKLNYIHRDLKPDNILLDNKGHIKLSDFGLCKHTEIRPRKFEFQKKTEEPQPDLTSSKGILNKKPQQPYKRNRQLAYSTVGTPDYIAPEVFGHNGYTETVDWWSLGVILFEMLVGYPPFFSEDPSMTCQKILHWRKTLVIPPEANLSPAAVDLLKKMISDANERLGVNGVEEIKIHPFFAGVDWKRIRDKKSPNIPDIKSEIDTSNFDKFDEEDQWYTEETGKKRTRKDANFIGYTFKRDIEQQRSHLVTALQDLEFTKLSQPRQQQKENIQTSQPQPSTTNGTKSQNPQLSNNIMNAISSISRMNHLQNVFPPNNTTSTASTSSMTNIQNTNSSNGTNGVSSLNSLGNSNLTTQSKANNYTAYESTQGATTTTYSGMYTTGSKSPTNATTNKEPSKYAQYIPREIPLRSNNLNPSSKLESTNAGYAKKDINITTNNPEINFMMKNKFTPTNNITSTTGGVGTTGKTFVPTTQLKKPTEGYAINTKIGLSKPGVSYTTTATKPLGGK